MTGTSKLIQYGLATFFTLMLITSTFAMQIQLAYAQVNINNTTDSNNSQNNILITNILAKNLENRIQKAGAILEITSKLPQVRDAPYADLLNQTLTTLHGIPQQADIEKRKVAQDILIADKDFEVIFSLMPNGDMYMEEPYYRQQNLTRDNFAFRDYYKGAVNTGNTYLGNVIISASSGLPQTNIALPVYSIKDNSTLAGIWAGGINFNVLDKELQSLNLTSLDDNARVVYVDNNGQKAVDSDVNKSTIPESFANLNSFKAAISGQAGSTIDTMNNNTKMLVAYQPVNAFHNTWAVLLIQPQTPK
jgi:Cache domain